jgi:hypothetical protein
MSIPSIRDAYLKGALSRGELVSALCYQVTQAQVCDALIQEWDQLVADGVRIDQPLSYPVPGVYFCTRCGQRREPRDLSRRGVCLACQDEIAFQVSWNLRARSGHYYRVWRDGMLRAAYRLEDESIAQRLSPRDPTPIE